MQDLELGYCDGDIDTNRSGNPDLATIVSERYSRRQALLGGMSAASLAFAGGLPLAACRSDGERTNLPPEASLDGQPTSSSGKFVPVTGTATDADGTIASTSIAQTGGPPVTLLNAGSLNAGFIAPAVAATTQLSFRLTVTDDRGKVTTADRAVSIEPARLDFVPVAKNRNDIVTVPTGYSISVLYRLGDPIAAGVPAFRNNGTDTGFSQRAGDHHDALYYYGLAPTGSARDDGSSTRGLLVINHENITINFLHPAGPTFVGGTRPAAEVIKEIEAHGVSVVEVRQGSASGLGRVGPWAYVPDSPLNRRITPNTPMQISGPARGNALMRTAYSPDGTQARGTINNCANGYTPWGTNLTCEENWAGYFRRPTSENAARTALGGLNAKSVNSYARYGVTSATGNYSWSTAAAADPNDSSFRRWDARIQTGAPADGTGDFRFEPFQFGWAVEIDPYDPAAAPRKRTALGRMGHEGAWPGLFVAGRSPAFYMGDDAHGEYMYKFVSAAKWLEADAQNANRLAIGDKYLDSGTLYAARFNADGSGTWLPLVFGQGPLTGANAAYPFADQADVLANARLAADAVGATRMDRPEWTAVNTVNGEVYLTLTNNNIATQNATGLNPANPRSYNDPRVDGRAAGSGNPNGHIVRLREAGNNTEATGFQWDIYLFAAGADLDPVNINVSKLNADNDMSSPDGLWFARPSNPSGQINPLLWIQNDDGAYTDVTNNMMLVGLPGQVGDGGARAITNSGTARAGTQPTFVGKEQTSTILKRFLVGPNECEITGIDSTPDGRTVFVNIQHPGEDTTVQQLGLEDPRAQQTSSWPGNQDQSSFTGRPRSATIVITKNDGGVVGL